MMVASIMKKTLLRHQQKALALSPKLGGDKAKAKGCIVWIWKIAQGKGKQATYPHSSDTYVHCEKYNAKEGNDISLCYLLLAIPHSPSHPKNMHARWSYT